MELNKQMLKKQNGFEDEDKVKENWERTSHIASIRDKPVQKEKENP